jgi:hypothetical protein
MGNIKRSVREKKFIKAYIENGGNATKAYIAINPDYKGNAADVLGSRMLGKVRITDDEIMEELGLTDNYLYEKLQEGTEATKTDRTGDEIADYAVRHQYIDTLLKLRKKYPAEKHEHEFKIPDVVEVVHYVQEGKPPTIKEEKDDNSNSRKTTE